MVVAAAEVVGGAVVAVTPPAGTSVAVPDVVVGVSVAVPVAVPVSVAVVVLVGAADEDEDEDDDGRSVRVRVKFPSRSRVDLALVVLPTGTTTGAVVASVPDPPGVVGAPGGLASG
jgi:hypothetical protein